MVFSYCVFQVLGGFLLLSNVYLNFFKKDSVQMSVSLLVDKFELSVNFWSFR